MRYIKWRVRKKYQEFNNLIIIKFIKKSFLFNLLKALTIIMIMILVIFFVKPKTAYIYAELKEADLSSLRYHAEQIEISDNSMDYASISSSEKIILDLNGLSINDLDYSEGAILEIYPSQNMPTYISFSGNIEKVYMYDADSNYNQYKIIYSKETTFRFIGAQHMKIDYGTAYIVNQNGEKKGLDCKDKLELINTNHKKIINEYQELINRMTDEEGKINKKDEIEYQNYLHIIDTFNNYESYSVRLYTDLSDISSDYHLSNNFVSFTTIKSNYLDYCEVSASGTVSFSYTPNAEEYSLNHQEINLKSDDNSINILYDTEDNKAIISGYVNFAQLSRMSLFPDFWNWYFSNIYMVPLTLVSAVFSALSMINSMKKNKQ